jgi:predicted enzyme related to lactoylglutathione lyase
MQKAVGLGAQIVVPKMAIPNVGWLAYAKDTEGNIFGMMQPDAGAK